MKWRLTEKFLTVLPDDARKTLSDTVEVTVFINSGGGEDELVTAGGKFVLRGGRVMVPGAFRPGEKE